MLVIKYFIISQRDDSYTILKHLLIGHYVKDDVQSFNVAICIKIQVQ
jgi:hypothetical protein